MAVTLNSADDALKSLYLDVVAEQLNKSVNPFYAAIEQSTDNVYGKEIIKLATYGVNGGIGAGTEVGNLPSAKSNNYEQMKLELKNLYGTIEISDKAVRASENSEGAFVNLLDAEMEGLIASSKFNFGRMLFGDGSGKLATVSSVEDGVIILDSVKNLIEGMVIDVRTAEGVAVEGFTAKTILAINRTTKGVTLSGASVTSDSVQEGCIITVQGSYNNEITGLGAIFGNGATLYGIEKENKDWLVPYVKQNQGNISELAIQTAIDSIEEKSGGRVNMIICSWGVRRALQALFSENKRVIDTMELAGGYKAMSYNGIPIVADRFCPDGTMYLLNTEDFCLHQLCDWQWLEGDNGKVLTQVAGKPIYTATLVKYADLMCSRPSGQGVITGITEQ